MPFCPVFTSEKCFLFIISWSFISFWLTLGNCVFSLFWLIFNDKLYRNLINSCCFLSSFSVNWFLLLLLIWAFSSYYILMKNISHTGLGTSTQESEWKSQSCPLRTSTDYLSGRHFNLMVLCYTVSLVLFLNLRKYCKFLKFLNLRKYVNCIWFDKAQTWVCSHCAKKKKLTQTCETKILLSSTF